MSGQFYTVLKDSPSRPHLEHQHRVGPNRYHHKLSYGLRSNDFCYVEWRFYETAIRFEGLSSVWTEKGIFFRGGRTNFVIKEPFHNEIWSLPVWGWTREIYHRLESCKQKRLHLDTMQRQRLRQPAQRQRSSVTYHKHTRDRICFNIEEQFDLALSIFWQRSTLPL